MTFEVQPTEIKREGEDGLTIVWSDGVTHTLSSEVLRNNCPSASSREARGDTSHQKPIAAKRSMLAVVEHTAEESLRLLKVWGVGNYAVGLEWGDGHNTGIYPYPLLRSLGEGSKS